MRVSPLLLGLFLVLSACTPMQAPPNVADTEEVLRLPSAQAFMFGPGDSLRIWVWRHEDLTVDVTIAPDGAITYPLVGRVVLAGLGYEAVVAKLQGAIDEYYVDAQVSVNITAVTNQKVVVIGEVETPQVLQIVNEMSLLEALTRTGGINPDARTNNVLVIRGGVEKPVLFTVNVDAIYGKGDFSQMVYLQRGDIIFVPAKTITNVERFFRRIQAVLAPAVSGSAIYRNIISGGAAGSNVVPN
ncbi:MAG: polysaccharide biosynthesis/export family protein [Pseudomonadota bacterium]|nr:polysaccharide biosynthesis/export family protein [Pseudomonadota bacterium]